MVHIQAYPGVYDSTNESNHAYDHANALAVKGEEAKFGALRDRSEEIIYATTLMDGSMICVYGYDVDQFYKLEGALVCKIKITQGDKVGILEKRLPGGNWINTNKKSNSVYWLETPLRPLNITQNVFHEIHRISNEIDRIGREFLAANIERLEYRHDVRDRVLKAAGLK